MRPGLHHGVLGCVGTMLEPISRAMERGHLLFLSTLVP
jgi:hypothetical protein